MDLFLTLFERQKKLLDLGEDLWVPYLIGALPSDVTSLIAREPEEKYRDYSHIRGMLLQRFKLTAEKFRDLFSITEKAQMGRGRIIILKSEHILKVPTCNLNVSQRTDVATNHINHTAQTRSPRLTLIDITFCGIKGRVCADTESSHSIAGERMFQIFKDKGLLFQETTLAMSLADSQQTTGEVLTTQVMVEIEGRSVLTKFLILSKAKRNRTLLGTDFFSSAGLVLDVKNTCWYFWDNPTHKYPFGEELDTSSIVEKMSRNTCQLREKEGESLTSAQKEKLNLLLESFQNVFEPAGEATNILEHHINTGNSPPISVPPYRMSPVKNCPDCIKYKASIQKPSGL
ncbi:uncharacterized protein TNCV_2548271 [Trichonephila clavipes]|nr:uncharacterized protein TNCV_2548271 [Trichonephila clavipes]